MEDADLWIEIWEELHRFHQEGTTGGGRARLSASLQEMQQMSSSEGYENDELAKVESDAGRTRCGAGESDHDSGMGGGLCSIALFS